MNYTIVNQTKTVAIACSDLSPFATERYSCIQAGIRREGRGEVMRLRHWLLASLAVPVSLAALWGFPEIAEASIGVGVQAGPVRLGSIAHPGGNYQLPSVYVVDTGTEAELISLRIDQPTHGKGRGIPPSWVQGTGASVRLAPHQSARIPLSLAVPADATPGTYLSDLVVGGSTVISSGQANFGAAAATTLEFRVAVIALVTVAALGACGQPQSAAAPGAGASITISLKVVPTVRSVTVSPGTATFGSCSGGSASLNTQSTSSALGYPNGYCWVGSPGSGGRFPVTVTNTGIASYIEVSSENAAPSDNGHQWSLCNLGSNPAVSCTGSSGRPAMDQYVLQSFASNGKQNADGLTGSPSCDADFGTARQCWTVQGDNAEEGFRLIGPESPDDSSTSWTVRITWEASPNL